MQEGQISKELRVAAKLLGFEIDGADLRYPWLAD
jgi:hypothetical protein